MQRPRFETSAHMLNAFDTSSLSAVHVYTLFAVRASAHKESYLKPSLLKFFVNVEASLFEVSLIKAFVSNISPIFIAQLRAFLSVVSLLTRIRSV